MHVLDQTDLLLDLLREAGDEPVTLDELTVVGVREPAQALLALELAGHSVHRVYETPRPGLSVTCVRLGAPRPVHAPPAPPASVPAPVGQPARAAIAAPRALAPAAAALDPRVVLGALLGALLVVLLARGRR